MPTDLKLSNNNNSNRLLNSRPKRTRQSSSLLNMMNTVVEEGTDLTEDEECRTADLTMSDNLSATTSCASEASSRGSNGSANAPPLLDFIGNTCMASAWFTSCFPCAVVDINDSDDYVVDRLSRESAMHTMYGTTTASSSSLNNINSNNNNNTNNIMTSSVVTPERDVRGGGRDKQSVMYVRLPESKDGAEEKDEDEGRRWTNDLDNAPIHTVASVIQEEDDDDDDDAGDDLDAHPDDVSPDDDDDSGILDDSRVPTPPIHEALRVHCEGEEEREREERANMLRSQQRPNKKKKFGMKKLFGRRNKGKC